MASIQEIVRMQNTIRKYLEDPGRSQNKLAQAIGVSSTAISQFLSGNYKGNQKKLLERIAAFFDLERERECLEIDPEFVRTRQADQVWRMAGLAHALKSISVIVGSSGLGKTTTLKEYAKKPNVVYVQCNPFMRGKHGFLEKICHEFSIEGASNHVVAFDRVCSLASARGALIILDDAQTLNTSNRNNTTVYEVIRAMNDQGIGIVVSGNGRVQDSVTSTDQEELYQQFASRSKIQTLDETFEREDVGAVVHSVIGTRLKGAEMDYLYRLANEHYGSLRIMLEALKLAVIQANSKSVPLSLELLREASRFAVSRQKPEFKPPTKKRMKINNAETPKDIDHEPVDDEEKRPTRIKASA